ncbi:Gfo/Idh/MocA family oxidoreductase [Candidatus Poribacteria bacterium]|nr:Gfo/Idh/MocA family oxidoreductase [Candidatus Poribacteria bacterium]
MKRYRVAVVGGAGTWGSRYLHAYANHPACEIVALVDRAKDRRQTFADRYGIEVVFDSLEELLAREVPDIVSAILPTSHNPDVVIACAEAGVKVVSCEKPIAVELSQADAMVRTCRGRGTVFSCGSVYSGVPYLLETIDWISAGNIGRLTAAAIPSGLPRELSGGGCVQLTLLRLLTDMEVEWVEGWTLPPDSDWLPPVDVSSSEIDCPAYGRLGLSGAIVCEIPVPPTEPGGSCPVRVTGENGQVWMTGPKPVFIQGSGAASTPVYPDFLDTPSPDDFFTRRIGWLMQAFDTGQDVLDSGHGYRQALEIAIALKQSAENGHRRIALPLEDRSLRIVPHPYRLLGGDVAGWESIGYRGPPNAE